MRVWARGARSGCVLVAALVSFVACGSSTGGAQHMQGAASGAGGASGAAAAGADSSASGTSTAGASGAGASASGGSQPSGGGSNASGAGGQSHAGGASGTGGNAGGAGAAIGQRCAPGTLVTSPYTSDAGNCYYWGQTHQGIPNIDDVDFRYIHLPTPTTPGEPYALSLGMESAGIDETVELWGSDAECGNAQELLWWGPLRGGEICTEFKATQVFSDLLMVWRPLWSRDANAVHDTITFCPTGTCGTARDGKGLGLDGATLEAPVGAYFVSAGILAGPLNFDAKVGFGWMHVKGHQSLALGGTAAVDTGYFRMEASEGFDDAWYCTGAGSSFTWLQQKRAHFDFAALTRLADCKHASGGTGTATFSSKTTLGAAVMVSNMPALADANATITSNGCFENAPSAACEISYTFSDGRPELRLHAFQSPTTRMQGQDLIQDFTDAALIVMPKDYGSPQIACAGQGSVTFATDGSLSISLAQIKPFGGCPGQPIVDTTFSGDVFF